MLFPRSEMLCALFAQPIPSHPPKWKEERQCKKEFNAKKWLSLFREKGMNHKVLQPSGHTSLRSKLTLHLNKLITPHKQICKYWQSKQLSSTQGIIIHCYWPNHPFQAYHLPKTFNIPLFQKVQLDVDQTNSFHKQDSQHVIFVHVSHCLAHQNNVQILEQAVTAPWIHSYFLTSAEGRDLKKTAIIWIHGEKLKARVHDKILREKNGILQRKWASHN